MNNREIEHHLAEHGVKPTAVRIVVWECVSPHQQPFSLKDVEEWLPYMDRSSIFRTLRLFASNQLLHEIDDGSGVGKYCVCRCHNERHIGHVHFTCLRCGATICLSDTQIPAVSLPAGYEMSSAEYLVKGLCEKCASF